jgi:hypothetical protein
MEGIQYNNKIFSKMESILTYFHQKLLHKSPMALNYNKVYISLKYMQLPKSLIVFVALIWSNVIEAQVSHKVAQFDIINQISINQPLNVLGTMDGNTNTQRHDYYIGALTANSVFSQGFEPCDSVILANNDTVAQNNIIIYFNQNMVQMDSILDNYTKPTATNYQDTIWNLFRGENEDVKYYSRPELDTTEEYDINKMRNIYGYGDCYVHANSLAAIFNRYTNKPSKIWVLQSSHAISELYNGKKWIYADADQRQLIYKLDNKSLASFGEVFEDLYLYKRTHLYDNRIMYTNSFNVASANGLLGSANVFQALNTIGNSTENLVVNLKPKEKIIFLPSSNDTFSHHIDSKKPDNGDLGKTIKKGFYINAPYFLNANLSNVFESTTNIINAPTDSTMLLASTVGNNSMVEYKKETTFPLTSGTVKFNCKLTSALDSITILFSKNGTEWELVKTISGIIDTNISENLFSFIKPNNSYATYEYYLKVEYSNIDSLNSISNLLFESQFQFNRNYPLNLKLGNNQVFVKSLDSNLLNCSLKISYTEDSTFKKPSRPMVATYPPNNSTIDSLVPYTTYFWWPYSYSSSPTYGYSINYQFQLSESSDFNHPFSVNYDIHLGNHFYAQPYYNLPVTDLFQHGKTYYWRVRGTDIDGMVSDWSPTWNFTYNCPMSPQNVRFKLLENDSVQLVWNANPLGQTPSTFKVHSSDTPRGFQPRVTNVLSTTSNNYINIALTGTKSNYRIIAYNSKSSAGPPSNFVALPKVKNIFYGDSVNFSNVMDSLNKPFHNYQGMGRNYFICGDTNYFFIDNNSKKITARKKGKSLISICYIDEDNTIDTIYRRQIIYNITCNPTKPELLASIFPTSSIYGDSVILDTVSYTGFINGDNSQDLLIQPYLSTQANALSNTGVYTVTIDGGFDTKYCISISDNIHTITKAPLQVNPKDTSSIYGEIPTLNGLEFSGFRNADTTIDIDTLPTISITANAQSNVGIYIIEANGGSDNNYYFVYNTGILSVLKASLQVIGHDTSSIYGESINTATYHIIGYKNVDNLDSIDVLPEVIANLTPNTASGNYNLVFGNGFDNNYDFIYFTAVYTIFKNTLIISAIDTIIEYGNAIYTNGYNVIGLQGIDNVDSINILPILQTNATSFSDAGIYNIGFSNIPQDNNYNFILNNGVLTIIKSNLLVIANDTVFQYGDIIYTNGMQFIGFKNLDDVLDIDNLPTIYTNATSTSIVGTYPIIVSQGFDNNYNIITQNGNLYIGKSPLQIIMNDTTSVYGETPILPNLIYLGFKGNDNVDSLEVAPTISTLADSTSIVGFYQIALSGAIDSNYNIFYQNGNLEITGALLSVTPVDVNSIYGDSIPFNGFVFSGFKNLDNADSLDSPPTYSTLANSLSDVGVYSLDAVGCFDNNYIINNIQGTVIISKANLVVSANNSSSIYGDPILLNGFSATGFKNGDTLSDLDNIITLNTIATVLSDIGVYPVLPFANADNNYNFIYNNGFHTINKKDLFISVNASQSIYGDTVNLNGYTLLGLANGQTDTVLIPLPILTTSATDSSDIGIYPISISSSNALNYNLIYQNAIHTIVPAQLVITIKDTSGIYGNAPVYAGANYIGFKNTDDVNIFSNQPIFSSVASPLSDVGHYPITCTNSTQIIDSNYIITFIDGDYNNVKRILNISAIGKSSYFDDPIPILDYTINGFVNNDTIIDLDQPLEITTTANNSSMAGVYPITVDPIIDNNYQVIIKDTFLVIKPILPQLEIELLSISDLGVAHLQISVLNSGGQSQKMKLHSEIKNVGNTKKVELIDLSVTQQNEKTYNQNSDFPLLLDKVYEIYATLENEAGIAQSNSLLISTVSENSIILFPNPTHDFINIFRKETAIANCKIYNSHGEIVFQTTLQNLVSTIDLRFLAAGNYLLEYATVSSTKKSIIQFTKQ